MPLPKYGERHANDRAYLCISIVGLKLLTFHKTIALQRYVMSPQSAHTSRENAIIISYFPASRQRRARRQKRTGLFLLAITAAAQG